MAGLLTGELAKLVYDGFKGKLLQGTLARAARDPAVELDDLGDPLDRVPTSYSCQGFTEDYSRYAKATAAIPDTDLKVNIFSKSLPVGVQPRQDDRVTFVGRTETYLLRSNISTDPAEALWVCQATPIKVNNEC